MFDIYVSVGIYVQYSRLKNQRKKSLDKRLLLLTLLQYKCRKIYLLKKRIDKVKRQGQTHIVHMFFSVI